MCVCVCVCVCFSLNKLKRKDPLVLTQMKSKDVLLVNKIVYCR